MVRLIPIQPQNMHRAWKDVSEFLERALKYSDGKYSLQDLRDLIQAKSLILWVVYNDEKEMAVGVLLTEILKYPQTQVLSVFILGGYDFNEVVLCLDELKEYAKGQGCSSIEFYGRRGWEKVLQKYQFELIHIVMRLKL